MLDHHTPIVARKSPFAPSPSPAVIAAACAGDCIDAEDRDNLRKVRELFEVTTVGLMMKEADREPRYTPLPWPLASASLVGVR